MKREQEVKDYAIGAADWIYVWGANGEALTEALIERLYAAYGSGQYGLSYYRNKLTNHAGKMAADCSGFIYPLSGYDDTANGYYNACTEKGPIASIPKDKVCLVFKKKGTIMNHIGIYLGDGTVAEMASSTINYRRTKLENVEWTHWGIPKWIDYTKEQIGWIKDDKGWWYRNADGSWPKNGWKLINHHWYLFGEDGYMLKGVQTYKNRLCYLEESGEYEGALWHEASDREGYLERWYVE